MKKIAIIGRIEVETNEGSGEVFLTHGKTTIRISSVCDGGLMVTFCGVGGNFIPDKLSGVPAILLVGK